MYILCVLLEVPRGCLLILLLLQSSAHASGEAAEHAGRLTDFGQRARSRETPADIESGSGFSRSSGCVFINRSWTDAATAGAWRGFRQERR